MRALIKIVALSLLLGSSLMGGAHAERGPIVVASKNFNESYLLAEVYAQLLEANGHSVNRKFGLGGTLICYEALREGEIDVYVEYTGTVAQAILKSGGSPSVAEVNQDLESLGLKLLSSIGFNNTYAIALKASLAERLGISSVSELVEQTDLNLAFSLEFLNREDGWPGLQQTYGFQQTPTGIEHGLAYQAIKEGKIDVTDAYSTDGDLERYQLTTLRDDRAYFPEYLAAPLVRTDLPEDIVSILEKLKNQIDDESMRRLNAEVVVQGRSFAEVASEFLYERGLTANKQDQDSAMWDRLWRNTVTHLQLTAIALLLGCIVGLGLGILVYRSATTSRVVLYVAGLMQTVPSIALLALMIPLFGIGFMPAIVALFLYSILPILRNTITALLTIDPLLRRVAEAIGLTNRQQLKHVLLPLALPNILAGIKTAAVISIGTATLAAFIGAGGLGEPIVTGLALNDTGLILQGAIPAAVLAILVELMFEGIERLLVKPHMLNRSLPV